VTYQKWRARLARANDPALIPIDHIDSQLGAGLAQFWATDEAAIVTELKAWPGGAVTIEVIAAAGKKGDITGPLHTAAREWAETQGATHILVAGRDGWRRVLPDFRHYQTILIKEL
jgi:hypothetical protein